MIGTNARVASRANHMKISIGPPKLELDKWTVQRAGSGPQAAVRRQMPLAAVSNPPQLRGKRARKVRTT